MILRVSSRIVTLAALVSLVAGCGAAEEASKDKQASDFYRESLKLDQQEACNAKGVVYDTMLGGADCTDIPLAKWACTTAGFDGRFAEVASAVMVSASLKSKVESGFEMAQCGEADDGRVLIILHKKWRDDKQAHAQAAAERFTVTGGKGASTATATSITIGGTGTGTSTSTGTDTSIATIPLTGDFMALVFTGQQYSAKVSLASFTGKTPDTATMRSVDAQVRHVTRSPSGVTYAITAHEFGTLDAATGAFVKVTLPPSVEVLSWAIGLGYDETAGDVLLLSLGGEGYLYRYKEATKVWSAVSLHNRDYAAAAWSDGKVYALDGNFQLSELDAGGNAVSTKPLTGLTSAGGQMLQLKTKAGGSLWLIVYVGGATQVFDVDPATGTATKL